MHSLASHFLCASVSLLVKEDCCFSVTESCPTLYDPMNCSMSGFPVLHHLPEFAQTHVHWVSDAFQPKEGWHPCLCYRVLWDNKRACSLLVEKGWTGDYSGSFHEVLLSTEVWKLSLLLYPFRSPLEGPHLLWVRWHHQDGWMASSSQWTWVWANSGRWWKTGKPGMLQSMELQNQAQLSDWTTTARINIYSSDYGLLALL